MLIIGLLAFTSGFSLLAAGLVGMVDWEPPQSRGERFLRVVDSVFAGGLVSMTLDTQKNWKDRSYERNVLITGVVCFIIGGALVLIAALLGA